LWGVVCERASMGPANLVGLGRCSWAQIDARSQSLAQNRVGPSSLRSGLVIRLGLRPRGALVESNLSPCSRLGVAGFETLSARAASVLVALRVSINAGMSP
jgi:hypothetical protein